MNRVSWSVEGIDPAVRERAEAAAQRAGMSLDEWIGSQLGAAAPPQSPGEDAAAVSGPAQDVAEIHQRLDSIARQIETMSRPPVRSGEPAVARQLNDAISRLDARLARITEPKADADAAPAPADRVERAAQQVYRASPSLDPSALDRAIAEITARQSELDATLQRLPPRQSPSIAPSMTPVAKAPSPDFSILQQHLVKITSQIEALQRPDSVEQSIAAFRTELAEIRQTITEAMPRRAIESIEREIKLLAQRIDETRACGIDAGALAGVERALGEIREALRTLTPAEQLAGFDEAIRNLGGKIDMIVRNSDDPGTVQQLESAIGALRGIVSNVASNQTLAQLSDNVHALADKVDQLGRSGNQADAITALESRIQALTSAVEGRERTAPAGSPEHLEGALKALSERLDKLPVGHDSESTFAHLEQRVSYLLERMEFAAEQRNGAGNNLGRVEAGLQDVLRLLERQQETFSAIAQMKTAAPAPSEPSLDPAVVDGIKRELADMRFNQSEQVRSTQDSLEAVHSTLGHVVDRLAMIEGDLRAARSAPPSPAPAPVATAVPASRPEMPNPAAASFTAAPREFAHAAPPAAAPAEPHSDDVLELAESDAQTSPAPRAFDTELPPDHPLEPGTRPPGRIATPSERIAASEIAISNITATKPEPPSTSNFIAAARRAAQAAAAAAPQKVEKTKPDSKKADNKKADAKKTEKPKSDAKPVLPGDAPPGSGSTLGTKVRALLVGASVIVIVLATFKMTMGLLDGGSTPPPAATSINEPASSTTPSEPAATDSTAPAAEPSPAAPPAAPSMISPTPVDRQSLYAPAAPAGAMASADITGSIPAPQPGAAPISGLAVPSSERLPDGIGGVALRNAALKGDPAAAYEVGMRYADGKGVPANFEEAAKWYGRAAQAGIVPAIFRLGTLNEKGLGVAKDGSAAKRYYQQAAEAGNAKAMHNLAVLEADGGSGNANYKTAAEWFRKAADRGVADSQFNLGILYARGIGVEQNLAESYKWFTLAAAQGDADAGKKRDDIAKRLDAQSLAAANLAVQTFTVEPQPDAAVKVAAPAGGWDTPAQAVKPAPAKRAAR